MTERKPRMLLKHYLKKLKLPTLLREYEAVAAACAKDNGDYVIQDRFFGRAER